MNRQAEQLSAPSRSEPVAFDLWFQRTLKDLYEPVLREPVPRDWLEMLPEPTLRVSRQG